MYKWRKCIKLDKNVLDKWQYKITKRLLFDLISNNYKIIWILSL